MRRFLLTGLLIISGLLQVLGAVSLEEFFTRSEIKDIRELETESFYSKIYEVMIEQPVDHHNPDGPKFKQRLYISHFNPDKPVVFITEGYSARFYYTSELASELECNQIIVEHRYFGKSTPDSLDWEYLNTWQAASDDHQIVEMFKQIYPGQWISTGISKGGQTAIYHSYYYPDDVDVRVPYVAPLNFSSEDQRIYSFLEQVGTNKDRRKVERFQKMALKNEDRYLPAFKKFSEQKGYTYDIAGGYEKAYEYCVLEYSFAFWQWGYVSASKIPGSLASPEEIIQHMNKVAGFDYFSDNFIEEYRPFFIQALSEMGYYGYDLSEFKKYIKHVDTPGFTFTLPDNYQVTYHPDLSNKVKYYLNEEADNFIFIYGEFDTWSATGVTLNGDTNSKIFVKKGGSHRTRINNMPADQREEVYATLHEMLQ